MVWYGIVWCGMVCHGMIWYGMVWYGTVWYGMVWYYIIWYDMVRMAERGFRNPYKLIFQSQNTFNEWLHEYSFIITIPYHTIPVHHLDSLPSRQSQ